MASPASVPDAQVRSKIAAKLAEALCTSKPSSSSAVDPALARELADEVEHEMSAAIRTTKEYTAKGLTVKAHAFTASARAAIEGNGGTCVVLPKTAPAEAPAAA